MYNYSFSRASQVSLENIHPDLASVFALAIGISDVDFGIEFPIRSLEAQKGLVNSGRSQTLNSRHILREHENFVHAADIFAWVEGAITWKPPYYYKIAQAMFRSAIEQQVQIEWGGHWMSLKDYGHWQLSWKEYK